MIWLNPTVIPRNAKKMIIARPISSGCLPVLRPTYVMVRPATTSIHRRRRCFAFISEYFHPIGKASYGSSSADVREASMPDTLSLDSPEAECRCSPDCAADPPHHADLRPTVSPQCQGGESPR